MSSRKPRVILKTTSQQTFWDKKDNLDAQTKTVVSKRKTRQNNISPEIDNSMTLPCDLPQNNIKDEKKTSDEENVKKKVITKKIKMNITVTEQSENDIAIKKPFQFLLEEKILPREFFTVDPVILAWNLLGKVIVRKIGNQIIKCKIVETEAYCGVQDKASHAYGGKITDRTKHIYQEGGHLYVYLIYGLSCCMNITARNEGEAGGVLVRAVEVLEGLDYVIANRNMKNLSKLGKELVNGPGKLCAALKIDRGLCTHDVTKDSEMYIIEGDNQPFEIVVSKRINVDSSGEYKHKPWRFYVKDNIYVSTKGVVLEITTSTTVFTQKGIIEEQVSQRIVESLEKYRAPSPIPKKDPSK